jgi:hypothetical protein
MALPPRKFEVGVGGEAVKRQDAREALTLRQAGRQANGECINCAG